jgi:hypothetical protein
MMRIGSGPALLFLPPLFEEMNRTRALLATVMGILAGEGYGCFLPDLPGTGESERALEEVSWDDWRSAAAAAAEACGATAGVSLRGGALLDDPVPRRWRFAPRHRRLACARPGSGRLDDRRAAGAATRRRRRCSRRSERPSPRRGRGADSAAVHGPGGRRPQARGTALVAPGRTSEFA